MAAKAKTKAKPTTKKTAKRTPAKSRPKGHLIPNHRFAPGTKVGVFPASEISVERGLGRAPIPKPTKSVAVKKDGSLTVSGLKKGVYLAAAPLPNEERYAYVQFSVK